MEPGCAAARCRESLLRERPRRRHGSHEFAPNAAIATAENRPPIEKKVFLHLVQLCTQRLIPGSAAKKKQKTLDILFTQLYEEGLRIMISKKKKPVG